MRPTEKAIAEAEKVCRTEIEKLVQELMALAESATALRADCQRLTGLRADGEKLERAIRTAVDSWAGLAKGRTPDPLNGEAVNEEHASRVIEARHESGGAKKGDKGDKSDSSGKGEKDGVLPLRKSEGAGG